MFMATSHYHVGNQLHRAEHAMGMAFTEALRPLGITPSQAAVLLHVDRYPDLNMARLAEVASVTPQTMHRIVVGLERSKLVHRNQRAGDRKSIYLSLTPAGADVLSQAEAILKAEQEVLRNTFSVQELDAFFDFLQRFEAAFQRPERRHS
jgi:DNA-binding MarR family transcriptional regulator